MSQFTRTENKKNLKTIKNNILVMTIGKELPVKKEKVEKLVRLTKNKQTKIIHITHTEALRGYEVVSTLINANFQIQSEEMLCPPRIMK